jgi:quercetin dioxygenase-like cupin family protein
MDNAVTVIDDIRELSPIDPDKLGHTTALKSEDVRVVVLTFPAGQTLKEHSSPKTLLMQALDGRLRVTVGDQVVDLVPGGLIRVEKLERHEVEALEASRLMLTLVG